ncbi:hypothetical protein VA249_45490 (plasmid) [Vibrio alfacsensis]|nr:hypothetical protein VA249_45490 [Vibrio alfacsensis]
MEKVEALFYNCAHCKRHIEVSEHEVKRTPKMDSHNVTIDLSSIFLPVKFKCPCGHYTIIADEPPQKGK